MPRHCRSMKTSKTGVTDKRTPSNSAEVVPHISSRTKTSVALAVGIQSLYRLLFVMLHEFQKPQALKFQSQRDPLNSPP